MAEKYRYDEELAPTNSTNKVEHLEANRRGSVGSIQDAVFGEITEDGPNYRDVGWLGTVALMMKTQIGLGVLGIPAVFDTLGLIPGVICLLLIGGITTWSGVVVGHFKIRHPAVYGIDDAGGLLFGRAGREIMAIAFCLYWICVAGSGMLSISIAFNSLSMHGTCTAVFVAVAALIGFGLGSIQTLGKITWLAWLGLAGIMFSLFTLTIAVGVQDRPASAPKEGPWSSDYKLIGSPTFAEASAALSTIVFAYAGTPAFFSIVSEMRDPKMYTRSLIVCQSTISIVYVTIGIVVYYFCGSFVASPALGSAGVLLKRICYGLALPGLIVSTTLLVHYPAKYVFIRALRGSKHLASNTPKHWMAWFGCTFGIALISYIIASAVPVFGGLVSLIGALLGTLMSFQPMGCMWLYDHWAEGKVQKTARWMFMVGFSIFVILSGTFLMIAGTYGSIAGIIDSYDGGTSAWSCADNSGSVDTGAAAGGGH